MDVVTTTEGSEKVQYVSALHTIDINFVKDQMQSFTDAIRKHENSRYEETLEICRSKALDKLYTKAKDAKGLYNIRTDLKMNEISGSVFASCFVEAVAVY